MVNSASQSLTATVDIVVLRATPCTSLLWDNIVGNWAVSHPVWESHSLSFHREASLPGLSIPGLHSFCFSCFRSYLKIHLGLRHPQPPQWPPVRGAKKIWTWVFSQDPRACLWVFLPPCKRCWGQRGKQRKTGFHLDVLVVLSWRNDEWFPEFMFKILNRIYELTQ